ncbi:MAG TPA: hypothetical protein VN923_03360 [Thermoanaerobaculia bacterium]|nr:hypothetical protein [Thermoanaerobaculia bacterium]
MARESRRLAAKHALLLHDPHALRSDRLALLASDEALGALRPLGADGRPLLAQRGRLAIEDVALGGAESRSLTLLADHPLGAVDVTLDARRSALLGHMLAFGASNVTLSTHLMSLRAHLMSLRAGLVPLGADLVTLGGRARRAALLHVLAIGLALDARLLVVGAALTVPAARRTGGGPGEQCEAQQKRSVGAFHGAPPTAARWGSKEWPGQAGCAALGPFEQGTYHSAAGSVRRVNPAITAVV